MCPACIATAALVVAGAMSAGGKTALVEKKLRAKTGVRRKRGSAGSSSSRPRSMDSRSTAFTSDRRARMQYRAASHADWRD
jgi:hypothetical protein